MSARPLPVARPPQQQRGVVLIIGLLLLLLLTLIGVSSMNQALLEERMTGNTQDQSVALQAAEAALRDGEQFLRQAALPAFDGNGGLYPEPDYSTEAPLWTTIDWEDEDAVRDYGGFEDAPGSLTKASAGYFIEELSPVVGPAGSLSADTPVDGAIHYRITARGVGISGTAVVELQSTYRR